MNRDNLLYYFPNEADILCQKNKKSPEYKNAKKTLNSVLGNVIIYGYQIGKGEIYELHKKYQKRLKKTIFCAWIMILLCFLLAVSDIVAENTMAEKILLSVILFLMIPALFSFFYILGTAIRLSLYKKKTLEIYMQNYMPRCTDYPDNLRDEIAKMGFDMFQNQEEIQGYEDFPEEFEDDEIRFENCVCAACKSRLKCDEVTDFDDYSAICPKCGEKAVIPDAENDISDVLLSAVHEYWFENC